MKVTVCFGPVRVIVPCGDGEILVKDLIRQAVHRYKKATGKALSLRVDKSSRRRLEHLVSIHVELSEICQRLTRFNSFIIYSFLISTFFCIVIHIYCVCYTYIVIDHKTEIDIYMARESFYIAVVHFFEMYCIANHCVRVNQKGSENWVAVHSLQTQRDGGILDPDDRLYDVADDREQIIANFGEGPGGGHGGGDGASSVGTSSPDIFTSCSSGKGGPGGGGTTDIEVTDSLLTGPPGLLSVRRGSDSALNQISVTSNGGGTMGEVVGGGGGPPLPGASDHPASKRWSAAPLISDSAPPPLLGPPQSRGLPSSRKDDRDDRWTTLEEEEPVNLRPPPAFARDGSNRLSIQFFGDNGYRWSEAAEKASNGALQNRMQSLSLPREHRRREPLGQAHASPPPPPSPLEGRSSTSTEYICLETRDGGSLGLHVVPDYDPAGREVGLLVQGVEPGGKVDLDGRIGLGDRLVEINGSNLIGQPFSVVQEIFRDALRSPELRLKVVRGGERGGFQSGVGLNGSSSSGGGGLLRASSGKKQGPPTLPKPSLPGVGLTQERAEPINMLGVQERCVGGSKVARKVAVSGAASLQSGNTRKLGKKVEISLRKGDFGLGFSVTTRDNPAGGHAPIYIKNILPKGAAVEDGRLRPGDRLLAVDGVDLTGKSQADVVGMLRNVPPGASVTLTVSRQGAPASVSPLPENMISGEMIPSSSNNSLTRTPDKEAFHNNINHSNHSNHNNHSNSKSDEGECSVYPWRQREILTFDIPVHESEKAGLGVSVKGKTSAGVQGGGGSSATSSSAPPLDLGIFVKSVIHGGAASRDGRLKTNDQLLSVNGVPLVGESNAAAMETLRRALVRTEGPVPGHITLSVARRLHRSDSLSSLLTDSSANTETFGVRPEDSPASATLPPTETSGNSENSDNTVIFVPPYKAHLENNISKRNAVVERLQPNNMDQQVANPLRNESYYRATHQQSMLHNSGNKLISTTINPPPQETVIIEDEIPAYHNSQLTKITEQEKIMNGQQRNSTSSSQTNNDITYASQLSLDDGGGFARDAFGRQSMSEKRHAALDAKATDTYQRNKKLREERERATKERLYRVNSAESIAKSENNNNDPNLKSTQLGPSLGMKKSSSLESLQTMVQEMQLAEEEGNGYRGGNGVKIVRGRGCNESFRAAVDRLAPLAEDEDSPLGRQASLNTSMDSKSSKGKKRPSLLKGLGSMFRFGGKRKEATGVGNVAPSEDEREAARRAARDEQERIQEQYRRLLIKQQEFQQQQHLQQQQHHQEDSESHSGSVQHQKSSTSSSSHHHHHHSNQQQQQQRSAAATLSHQQQEQQQQQEENKYCSLPTEPSSRAERIHQLRLEHQRRHSERRGHYPLDHREDIYEHHIKQRLDNGELEPAINRPGSRVGITDASRFSHYVNYQEIQQHLKEEIAGVKLRRPKSHREPAGGSTTEESRRQQHYHSQRAASSREQVHRPVSNFYEYESVQAVLRGDTGTESRRTEHHTKYSSTNMNGYQPAARYSAFGYPAQTNGLPYTTSSHYQSRPSYKQGPFVTHVTIRETQPKV